MVLNIKEGNMGWYAKKIQQIKGLDTPKFIMLVTSKSMGGLAIGILIAPYVGQIGWWVMLAAVIIAVPPMIDVFGKK